MDMSDRDQLHGLFLQHRQMLEAYVRALVGDPVDAEDVFQDIGMVVLRKNVEDLPVAERFPAWLRGIARNVVYKHYRSRRRRREELWDNFQRVVDQAFDEADSKAHDLEAERVALQSCLERLSGNGRSLLAARYTDAKPIDDLAKQRNKSAAAIRMLLMRLRKKLLLCLQRAGVVS